MSKVHLAIVECETRTWPRRACLLVLVAVASDVPDHYAKAGDVADETHQVAKLPPVTEFAPVLG